MHKNKKMFFFILLPVVIILSTIIFLPKIFSTKAGTKLLLKNIENNINGKIEADSFSLSWLGPQTIKNLKYKDANLDIQIDSISSKMSLLSLKSFYKKNKLKFIADTKINDLNVHLHYPNLPKASIYDVYVSIYANPQQVNSISLSGKTKENSATGDIKADIDFIKDKIIAKISGNNIPTVVIDRFIFFYKNKYQNMLVQLLGPSFNIKINSVLEKRTGPIYIDIDSTYSKAKINLFYEKSRITLKDPAIITTDLPGINPIFLKNINYIKSIEPIKISISNQDFEIPISPFKWEKLKVKQATIDLNKILVSKTGLLKALINFTKISSSDLVSLWFTNANIQIDNKNIYTDRIDFLINDEIHLCLWGKIDLHDHHLRLNLGIPEDTLSSVFGIQNLPSDYVIKIPVKGTLENPKIDAKAASAKILALSTLQSGKGLGSIISGVITKMQKTEDIPPAKRPFPWEGNIKKNIKVQPNIDLEKLFDNFE